MGEANQQRKWVREEVVILVTEYLRTKNMPIDARGCVQKVGLCSA